MAATTIQLGAQTAHELARLKGTWALDSYDAVVRRLLREQRKREWLPKIRGMAKGQLAYPYERDRSGHRD